MTEILLKEIPLNGGTEMPEYKALSAQGAKIEFNNVDTRTLILAENTAAAAKTITFKAGCGIQSVVDLQIAIPAGAKMGFTLESGAFKNKGFVYAQGDTAIKIAAVVLP